MPGPVGFLGGHLTATAGATTVQTALGLESESEVYPLTIRNIGRDGQQTADYGVTMFDLDQEGWFEFGGPSTLSLRLPKGRYSVSSAMVGTLGSQPWIAQLLRPELMLDRPRALTFDAERPSRSPSRCRAPRRATCSSTPAT